MNFWRLKIIVKIILSRLPIDYRIWSKLGLFKHGNMDSFEYAWKVLNKHILSVELLEKKWKGMELGPGDSLLSAFIAPALNSKGLDLLDSGCFANKDVNFYINNINSLRKKITNIRLPKVPFKNNINDSLATVNSRYYYQGLSSFKKISDDSYDFIFSQAVLEHIRRNEFEVMMKECYRVLNHNGVMSHVVDFKDHLGGGLNNMRFSSKIWESDWFSFNSGFYTNRLKLSEIVEICKNVGFDVNILKVNTWGSLPLSKKHLAKEFHNISDKDLLVYGAHLIMKKNNIFL
jgi:SAM-dependent methyltransferase